MEQKMQKKTNFWKQMTNFSTIGDVLRERYVSLISSHKNRLCLLERGIVHLKFQFFCDFDELDLLEKSFFL